MSDRDDTIRRLAAEGLTTREIGQQLGITRNAVIGVCYRNKIKLHHRPGGEENRPWTAEEKAAVVAASGYGSIKALAAEMGRSRMALSMMRQRERRR